MYPLIIQVVHLIMLGNIQKVYNAGSGELGGGGCSFHDKVLCKFRRGDQIPPSYPEVRTFKNLKSFLIEPLIKRHYYSIFG